MDSLLVAEKQLRAQPQDMFNDIYDVMPAHLSKQKQEMIAHVKKYQDEYPLHKHEKM